MERKKKVLKNRVHVTALVLVDLFFIHFRNMLHDLPLPPPSFGKNEH